MITTKSSISDVAAVLDPSQLIQEQIGKKKVYKFALIYFSAFIRVETLSGVKNKYSSYKITKNFVQC